MAKDLRHSLFTFLRNMWGHLGRVFSRKESLRHAAKDVGRDARKLRHAAHGPDTPARQRAKQLTKRGRSAYNAGDYDKADDLFRRAMLEDEHYARPYAYLGYALYQRGRTKEAIRYWELAVEVDPQSHAAERAREKLRVLDRQKHDLNEWMNEKLGGGD
jgi:tetratricopeptide (TPR) repeat protein